MAKNYAMEKPSRTRRNIIEKEKSSSTLPSCLGKVYETTGKVYNTTMLLYIYQIKVLTHGK